MRLRVFMVGMAAAVLLAGCGTMMHAWSQPRAPSRPVITAPTVSPKAPEPKEGHKAGADREEARAIEQLEEEHRRRLKKEKEAKLKEQVKAEDVEAGANLP